MPGLNATSLFYFGLGAFLSLGDYSLTTVFKKYKILLICAFVSLFLIEVILDGHNTQWGNIIYPFYVFVGVIAFLNMNITGGQFSRFSFFIFAFHPFVYPVVTKCLNRLMSLVTQIPLRDINGLTYANNYPYLVIIESVAIIAITVLISMAIYVIISKYMPRTSHLLCGR